MENIWQKMFPKLWHPKTSFLFKKTSHVKGKTFYFITEKSKFKARKKKITESQYLIKATIIENPHPKKWFLFCFLMNMSDKELSGNLRSVTQFLFGIAAPLHDQAPLTQSMWRRQLCYGSSKEAQCRSEYMDTYTEQQVLLLSFFAYACGVDLMLSAPPMETSCGHIVFGRNTTEKCEAYKVK